jgi:HlyD family secretion protein
MSAPIHASIRRHLRLGVAVVVAVIGGIGGWAATTAISGAVIAPGVVVVESDVKKVQHPTGGIVGQLWARNGDHVRAGDLLVRLDDTIPHANLAIVVKGLDEMLARKARLEAERDGQDVITFPGELQTRSDDPEVARVMHGESKLFHLRAAARTGQREQLRQHIYQMNQEIAGLTTQAEAKRKEIELIQRELVGARELWKLQLIPISKLTALEREATRLEGEVGQLIASTAQTHGKIAETELKIFQIDRDLTSDVAKELREVDGKIGELIERKVTAEDQLKRIDIRAPQDGTVHESTVHTVGGVVIQGEALMLIVPNADTLTVEARVAPQEIDQLRLAQTARLRFTAFNQRTTPEIDGTLARISADISTDQRTGVGFYTVRAAIPSAEIARLGDVKLVPGMPVEVFIEAADRSVLSYLVKPLYDQISRAFHEK